jgi:HK97 gp10 family phage protein
MARLKSNKAAVQAQMERKLDARLALAGEFVTGAAKLLAPVDTGNLRGSIDHRKAGRLIQRIGTNVEYAAYVELGTRRMRARPYLLPALIENKREIMRIIKRS